MSVNDWLGGIARESVSKLLKRTGSRPAKRKAAPRAVIFDPETLEARRLLAAGPSVLSINRATPASGSTGSATVSFTVTFSETVTGVKAADFGLVTTGTVAASHNLTVTAVSGSVYTVNVFGISGSGTLGLDLSTGAGIQDGQGNPLLINNSQTTFRPQQSYPISPYPRSVALADLTGDGILDVVTANGSGSVSVLLGNGNGTFQAARSFAAGPNPYSVAVVDLNGDGKLDLAVADVGGADVAVLLGNGNGTFQAPQTFATGPGPQSVVAADVNGDGKSDLITANYSGSSVSVLLGNGNGTFQPQQTFATGSGPFFLSAGDLNGDGKVDLAVADSTAQTVSVLLGNGNGTFAPQHAYFAGRLPKSVVIKDINGDGKPDLIVANNYTGTAGVLFGNGDGTFRPTTTFYAGLYPWAATTGDINGDGLTDLVVADEMGNSVTVVLNSGIGTFNSHHSFAVGNFPASVAVGDLNGDGQLDIVTANESSNSVSVLLADGTGGFAGQTYNIAAPSPLSVTLGGTIPTSVVAGQKIKLNPTITLSDVGGATFKGSVTESLYLSSSTVFDSTAIALGQSATRKLNLRSGGHTSFKVNLSSLPATLPGGTYHVLVNLTEPGGVTAFAVATQTITVGPAQITLTGSISKIPATAKAGKPLPLTISVGTSTLSNIPATGSLPLLVYTSPDGLLSDATQISSQSHKINIKPGKTIRFALSKLVAPTTAGHYFILVRLDPGATFAAVTNPNLLLTSTAAVTVS